MLLEDRIDDLCDNFDAYVNLALNTYRLDTPARHFHIKTIEHLTRCKDFNVVFDDDLFFDYLYATLVAWGMGSRAARLCGFTQFKDSIINNRETISELNKYSLRLLAKEDDLKSEIFTNTIKLIENVLSQISVSATESKLVANTKALHHLLPELIPPVDRNYTLRFFFNSKAVRKGDKSISQFFDVFVNFIYIYEMLGEEIDNMIEAHSWNSSITKIIDNAIIGYWIKKDNALS